MTIVFQKLLTVFLFALFCGLKVNSEDSSNEDSINELLDVHTEFKFSSLEDLSYLAQRMTMSSDELETDGADEGDEEFKHNMKGMLDESLRWPKDLEGSVIIPYEFSKRSRYTNAQKKLIRTCMKIIEKHTCIRYVKRDDEDENFIHFYAGKGCDSHVGMTGGRQRISLNKGKDTTCLDRGTILHELVHALGFDHMHNHPDRDYYVKINWRNIEEDNHSEFEKVDDTEYTDFGTGYDYYSIMHYAKNAFAVDEAKPTITARNPKNPKLDKVIGQRDSISRGDIRRINRMYKCKDVTYN